MTLLEKLLFSAGLLHFCQLPAMMFSPKMLGWDEDLAKLSTINRRIVLVMGGGIMLTVLGSGVVVAFNARHIAAGGPLARALSLFLASLWIYRGSIQVAIYARIWPSGWFARLSHYGLVVLFGYLSAVYLLAFALMPGFSDQ